MHFAVTGANGFVGKRLVRMLRRKGHEVTALARTDAAVVDGVRAIKWDVTGEAPKILESAECVVHAAVYRPAVQVDPEAAWGCLSVNALGTLNVLRAAERAKVAHTVILSAGNVYDPSLDIADESARAWPVAQAPYYLSSKWVADVYAEHFRTSRGLSVTTLRPSSIYGPGMKSGVLRSFAERALSGAPLEIDGDGSYATDFVWVDDVVVATLAAAERRAAGVVNIGSGQATTLRDLAESVVRAAIGTSSTIRLKGGPSGSRGFAPLDIRLARSLLGFAPTPIEDGVRRYVASLRGDDV